MKDIIKTCGCGLTFREPKEAQGHCPACVMRARSEQSNEVVRAKGEETVAASGNSEGAKKGWEGRPYPHRQDGEDESGFMDRMAGRSPHEMIKKDWDRFQNYEYLAGGSRRERQGMYGMGTQQGRDSVHKSWVKQAVEKGDSVHPEVLKDYPEFAKASDPTSTDVVHCRASSAAGPVSECGAFPLIWQSVAA